MVRSKHRCHLGLRVTQLRHWYDRDRTSTLGAPENSEMVVVLEIVSRCDMSCSRRTILPGSEVSANRAWAFGGPIVWQGDCASELRSWEDTSVPCSRLRRN